MKGNRILCICCFSICLTAFSQAQTLPWTNGSLQVSGESRYLKHTNGTPAMQFLKPDVNPAYGATTLWYDALKDPGFNQMKSICEVLIVY